MFPKILQPTDTEPFHIDDITIDVPKCLVTFDKWTGVPVKETFGGKPILNVSDSPMFAELAIMTHFQNSGWQTRWIENYGKREPICLTEWKDDKYKNQINVPFLDNKISTMLASIAKLNNNSYSGCWDIVASKDDQIIFAESKRTKKDSIRLTQINWLAARLKYGLQSGNFLLVQWET